jgi:hypothetical protein
LNIEFAYLYRDFGNFKSYNSVVFGNKNNLAPKEIDQIICEALGNDHFFEASRLKVPEMFFKQFPYDPKLDWTMHEYCGVSQTASPINDVQSRDISDLLSRLVQHMSRC